MWIEGRGVYGATGVGTYSLDSTYYLDPALFRFEAGRVKDLEVLRDGERVLHLKRGARGAWTDQAGSSLTGTGSSLAGTVQPTTRVENLLTTLARLPQRGLAERNGAETDGVEAGPGATPDWIFRALLDDDTKEGLEVTEIDGGGWTARRSEWTTDWRVELPPGAFRDVLVRLEGFGVRR